MADKQLEKELLSYLKSEPVLRKLLQGFQRKYISYGAFTGSVVLRNLSSNDIEVLEGFFCKNYHGKQSITISTERFRQALLSGKYQEITPEQILEAFSGEKLIGRKEQKKIFEQKKQQILNEWILKYDNTRAAANLETILEIIKTPTEDTLENWKEALDLGAQIWNHLPYQNGRMLYVAVFAAMLTGNPHSFDTNTTNGQYLYQLIQADLNLREKEIESLELFPAYKRQKSYLEAGLMIDDVSNFTMLYGIHAIKKNEKYHQGVEGFLEERQMMQIPLAVISQWSRITCPKNRIYIVENPSIFAMLCANKPDEAHMCMNGQPCLAGILVLELLAKSKTEIYYSGDLDPEGLLIAQKLKNFYHSSFHYWHMTKEDYLQSKSEESISEKRLKILEKIKDEELLEVKNLLLENKKAGYQEKMLFFGKKQL